MSSAGVLHLVDIAWLRKKLARPWSGGSLAPLLDAPLIERLTEL